MPFIIHRANHPEILSKIPRIRKRDRFHFFLFVERDKMKEESE